LDSGKRKNSRQDTGFDPLLEKHVPPKSWHGMRLIGKESGVWGRYICMTEVWDAGLSLKRSGNAG